MTKLNHKPNHLIDLDHVDITLSKDEMRPYLQHPFCQMVFESFQTYYPKVGFLKPWIGYFFLHNTEVVATGGFKGQPKKNRVEIAYGTLPEKEGMGYATRVCQMLITIAIAENPHLIVTARTLMHENPSTAILRKNGFNLMGSVLDPDDGEVWEWQLKQ